MSVASATMGDGRVVSQAEERRVIFASSLGTVFEWYDFYLYATLAPFFAALFFPPGNETAALLSAFAAYAAGFLVRPFGALVFGRIGDLVGRKYTFLVTILFMGASTFAVGLLPTYAAIGLARAGAAGLAAPGPGPGAGRRVWRRGDLRGRACAARPSRLRHELDPDHGDAGLLPVARGHRRSAARRWTPRSSPTGAGACRSWSRWSCWSFSVYIRLKLNESPIFTADEGRGQGLEVAADRQLPALSEQQDRAAGAVRRDRRPGRGVVHRAVLRPVLPAHHAEARLPDGLHR